jgi:uncharacterized protein
MVKSAASHSDSKVVGSKIAGTIDPARFAREGGLLTGTMSPAQLPRLADELFDEAGEVDYRVQGLLTAKGEPALRVKLAIDVALPCQRCMERLPVKLDVERTLVFSREIAELEPASEEEDEVDVIPLVASLDVLDLIDQEVMLSLPIAPRHDEDVCEAQVDGGPESAEASPFSVLSQLKRT